MKKRLLIFFLLFSLVNDLEASPQKKIISKFETVNNLAFNFDQIIGESQETGNCIVEYSKKIYCKYDSVYNKILVSNGKSLVIKSGKNNQYYRYDLIKTPFNLILDKKFIIDKLKKISGEMVGDKIKFAIDDNNTLIDIFFDNSNYDIIGWKTTDVYNNSVYTNIYNIKYNILVDKKKFRLPEIN
jgi:outer membrane lipoprotein-sorting protein|tara:strand:- start:3068 stop:3622 length:555 start_codon:yes stop_codon:yes gene_type:complete